MSAWIVPDATMHDAVAAIMERKHPSGMFLGIYLDKPDAPDLIGRALFHLNHQAMFERYGELVPEIETIRYKFNRNAASSNVLQRQQSLRCLRYQCMEGDVIESPNFLELTAVYNQGIDLQARRGFENTKWGRS